MELTVSVVELVLLVLVTGLNLKTFLRLIYYRFLVRLQPNKNVRRFSQEKRNLCSDISLRTTKLQLWFLLGSSELHLHSFLHNKCDYF